MTRSSARNRAGVLGILFPLVFAAGVGIVVIPRSGYAVPIVKGFYFINDQYNEAPLTHNNFASGGVSFNAEDHIFSKNRLGATFSLPYTKNEGSGRTSESFAPQEVVNVTGKDYTFNLTNGIVRNFDPLVGERSSHNTAINLSITPEKFIPIFANFRQNKSIVGSDSSTVRNWAVSTDFRIHPFHISGGSFKQENVSSGEGSLSESEGNFGQVDANFFLWENTVLQANYDIATNKNRFKETRSKTDSTKLSLFANSSPFNWMTISGSFIQDSNDSTTTVTIGETSFFTDEERYDLTVQVNPIGGWVFSIHKGHSRTDSSGDIRALDLLTYSLSLTKELTSAVDGSVSLNRTDNDDHDRGKTTSNAIFLTANMRLNPALTLRINQAVSKGELSGTSEVGSVKPRNYTASTNVDLSGLLTPRVSLATHYSASDGSTDFLLFGTATQSLSGTVSYIPKNSVVYGLSVTKNISASGDSSSSYNASMAYNFHKSSRMTLAYVRSEGGEIADNSLSGNFILTFPKQVSLTVNFSESGIGSGNEAKAVGVQFSLPL